MNKEELHDMEEETELTQPDKNEKVTVQIKGRLEKRLEKLLYPISQIAFKGDTSFEFIVAGNSLNSERPNDYDLFPCDRAWHISGGEYPIACETRNAKTYNINGTLIQFCNYRKNSLKELVDSFDFAHIKLGAKVQCEWAITLKIKDIELYLSDDWVSAKLMDESYYTGSEYPLSSLIRLNKYYKRGDLKRKGLNTVVILTDIIKRGFDSYSDFKNQVEAVDLRYEEDGMELWNLYQSCVDKGLVTTPHENL